MSPNKEAGRDCRIDRTMVTELDVVLRQTLEDTRASVGRDLDESEFETGGQMDYADIGSMRRRCS